MVTIHMLVLISLAVQDHMHGIHLLILLPKSYCSCPSVKIVRQSGLDVASGCCMEIVILPPSRLYTYARR